MTQIYRIPLVCFVLFLSLNLSAQFWDLRPSAVCESGVNVSVGFDCTATITPEMIDGGSYSIVDPVSMSVSPSVLAPGTHIVQLTVSNTFGSRFCQAVVFVEDKTAPTAVCRDAVTVTIDDPTTLPNVLSPNVIDAGSYDNCGVIASRWVDVDGITYYGSVTATLTVTDEAGNENSCWSYVNLRSPHYSGGVCVGEGNTDYEYINSFAWNSPVENFSILSGDNDGRVFFVGERNVRSGDAVTVSYSPGYVFGSYREYWRIYLDMNRDGDWDDAGEMLHQWNGYGGNTATINLPTFFGRYGISRMRVIMSYSGYKDPCSIGFYGEVEDYAVRLTSPFSFRPDASELTYAYDEVDHDCDEFGTYPAVPNVTLPPRLPETDGVKLFPNPAAAGQVVTLTIAGPRSQVQGVELRSLAGQVLRRYPAATTGRMDLQLPDNLVPGLYLLSGSSIDGQEWTQKLLVQ